MNHVEPIRRIMEREAAERVVREEAAIREQLIQRIDMRFGTITGPAAFNRYMAEVAVNELEDYYRTGVMPDVQSPH